MPEVHELKCSHCHRILPVSEFHARKNRSRGYKYDCKACEKKRLARRLRARVSPELKKMRALRKKRSHKLAHSRNTAMARETRRQERNDKAKTRYHQKKAELEALQARISQLEEALSHSDQLVKENKEKVRRARTRAKLVEAIDEVKPHYPR
ncbi:MAG: hypothetical protein KGL39_16510 [Patescibacteria group bacterium]|nr:hypothetical protein [Patescibacteria group bacterium]